MKSKKLDKRKMRDQDFLNAHKDGLCLRCVKRKADKGLVCSFCHTYYQQIARAAVPAPYTLDELQQILERLEELWP